MANRYVSLGRRAAYSLRLTELEMADLQTRATARGLTIAEVIRDALGFRTPESTCTTGTCGHYEHRLAHKAAVAFTGTCRVCGQLTTGDGDIHQACNTEGSP